MRNSNCRGPRSPPWFQKGSFSGNLFCRFPSTDGYQSSLMQETDADGMENCHSSFPQSLQLPLCCWIQILISPSLLSASCLHCTSPCLQFHCPHHFSSPLLAAGSFSVSRFAHLFPRTTGPFISQLCKPPCDIPLQGLHPSLHWSGSLSCLSAAASHTPIRGGSKESQELLSEYKKNHQPI